MIIHIYLFQYLYGWFFAGARRKMKISQSNAPDKHSFEGTCWEGPPEKILGDITDWTEANTCVCVQCLKPEKFYLLFGIMWEKHTG